MPLTDQRKLFVDEYIRGHCKNATQAAIAAGYSKKTASSQASDLLKVPEVSKYLEEQKKKLESDLRQEFIFEASEAFKVMRAIMKNEDARDADKINVAKDFLDRAGFKPQEKVEITQPLDESVKEMEAYFERLKTENP
ncbi:terminase small subunit [Akkermansia muciniphila]|uniref:terminase small subunit n=1 Tax=Akkermansia muciniphila TaxID=239935 RepID=UPI00122EE402|nr:terminase small subunit [Akkermansia muciniphila]